MRSPRSRNRFLRKRSELTVKQILAWADAYFERKGKWPQAKSGPVWEVAGEKWGNINLALGMGHRGLPGGGSLAKLLAKHRGKRNHKALPQYTIRQILQWADAHRARFGKWPKRTSGPVCDAPGETWQAVQQALRAGLRGLPGGSSLTQLLTQERGVRNDKAKPRLSITQIVAWADAYHSRTGNWPTLQCGVIHDWPHDTWSSVDRALRRGGRGLRKGDSLSRVLARHRGVSRYVRKPPLSIDTILDWSDAYYARTGFWPNHKSGPIAEAPSETWERIDNALRVRKRGLAGGMTLARLLVARRQVRNRASLPKLSEKQILTWAREYKRKHGKWPQRCSLVIPGSGGETWNAVNLALCRGTRGISRRTSLVRLLRGK